MCQESDIIIIDFKFWINMDSAVTDKINALIDIIWTDLYAPTSQSLAPMHYFVVLGYVGAMFAFFFSLAGAYIQGSKLVTSLETSFFAFLDDFENDGRYIN